MCVYFISLEWEIINYSIFYLLCSRKIHFCQFKSMQTSRLRCFCAWMVKKNLTAFWALLVIIKWIVVEVIHLLVVFLVSVDFKDCWVVDQSWSCATGKMLCHIEKKYKNQFSTLLTLPLRALWRRYSWLKKACFGHWQLEKKRKTVRYWSLWWNRKSTLLWKIKGNKYLINPTVR